MTKEVQKIGCCGANCKTCQVFAEGFCRGCKLGYERGERNLSKIKCEMKACCFKERKFETCADCPDYSNCPIIHGFYSKKGYKYKKYKEAIEFIRNNGYAKFIKTASNWKGPYGKFE